MDAVPTSITARGPVLTSAEAEAIATAAALHHLRAAQAAASSGGPAPDTLSPWAREAMLRSVDKSPLRTTGWGTRTWG